MPAKSKTNELHLIRVFDAPVKAVWEAWHDPEQVVQWWGPRGFTLTHHSKDLRPGGHWKYTMHGPDGTDYPNLTKYHEVEKHSRMVYDHGGTEDAPPLFRVTVLFREIAKDQTQLELTMAFATPQVAEQMRGFINQVGGDSTWDRLAEYLDHEVRGRDDFVINRSFDAPIELMYEMWTDPQHVAQWLPPTGMQMQYVRADLRPGGRSFYKMSNGQGLAMYGHIEYREMTRPRRLVYTQQFADEHEKLSRHPLAPTWPAKMLTTVTFTEEGPDRTRVTVKWEPCGDFTREELETFLKARGGMTQGWTGSFDKLEARLGT